MREKLIAHAISGVSGRLDVIDGGSNREPCVGFWDNEIQICEAGVVVILFIMSTSSGSYIVVISSQHLHDTCCDEYRSFIWRLWLYCVVITIDLSDKVARGMQFTFMRKINRSIQRTRKIYESFFYLFSIYQLILCLLPRRRWWALLRWVCVLFRLLVYIFKLFFWFLFFSMICCLVLFVCPLGINSTTPGK